MNKELDLELQDIFPDDTEIETLKNVPAPIQSKEVVVEEAEIIDITPTVAPSDAELERMAEEDFKYARKQVKDAIDATKHVLDEAEGFAAGSMDPEVLNSFSSLVKSVTDGSTKLLDLHSKLKAFKKKDKSDAPVDKSVTNNTLIVTTADMLKMVKKELNK